MLTFFPVQCVALSFNYYILFVSFLHALNGILRDLLRSLYRCHIAYYGSIYKQSFSLMLSKPLCVYFANICLLYTEYLQLYTYRWMSVITSVTMAMNYCDLMLISVHLNLGHPYIVNGSQWMDKKLNKYIQAVHFVT